MHPVYEMRTRRSCRTLLPLRTPVSAGTIVIGIRRGSLGSALAGLPDRPGQGSAPTHSPAIRL